MKFLGIFIYLYKTFNNCELLIVI